ncbi:hypothetical protein BGP77_03995 [Saccharospirillum sp. MSK14-1]|nr:hypothetical protein BGP77_03995 [Saccharospirillum sp. MSK14-1]
MITLRRLTPADWDDARTLSVAQAQREFVGTLDDILDAAQPTDHFHFIERDNEPVGFCNIDTAYSQYYEFAEPGELGLRSFLIDQRFQGQGLGKATSAALLPYLKRHYHQHPAIVLTVNQRNLAAYHLYRLAGFEDDGELYLGGAAGPQHVLRLRLNA